MSAGVSFDEIFAVMAAASVGDTAARVRLPADLDVEDLATRFAVALNLLLDDLGSRAALLQSKLDFIALQQSTILELSTPALMPIEGVLLLPLVGLLDQARARQLTETLLARVGATRARHVIIDLTGVPRVDDATLLALVNSAAAANLMGAAPVLVGLSAAVADQVSSSGVDLRGIRIAPELADAISQVLRKEPRFSPESPPRSDESL